MKNILLTLTERELCNAIAEKESELIEFASFYKDVNKDDRKAIYDFKRKMVYLRLDMERLTNAFLKKTASGTEFHFKQKISMKIN